MPTEELENELRRVLARAAADIADPEQARQRLLQRNYRPGGHRRLAAGITAASAVAAVVLGLGLSGGLGSAPARDTGTIRTVAFTLVEHANGTATLTINAQRVLLDPSALRRALRQHGIPAIVTVGSFCSSDPIPAGFAQVMSVPTGPPPSYTINPAAIPAGTELSFGTEKIPNPPAYRHRPLRTTTFIELIDTNSYTCSSALPVQPTCSQGSTMGFIPPDVWVLGCVTNQPDRNRPGP